MNSELKINEIPNTNEIKIKKFQFSCDDVDKEIPQPLPQTLNHFMGFIGKAGSGKTTLLLNLICKAKRKGSSGMYNKKFDKIYIISPSLATMEKNPFESIPEDQIYDELSVETLETILEEISETGEKVLLIIDDCVNDMSKNMELQLLIRKIAMNRRHLSGYGGGVSIWITSQVYNAIPLCIRKCLSHLFLLNSKQRREIDSLFDEHILIKKEDFYKILKHTFQEPRDFLYLDLQNTYDKMFHRNFNKLNLVFDEV